MNGWEDDDWDAEEDALVTCPECGEDVYLDLNDEQCPECGYWFLPADRDKMWQQSGEGKSRLIQFVALVVLLALLLPLLLHFLS